MCNTRENVRRNLSYYIKLKGLNQKELSEKLDISQSAVNNWIKGKNSPDIEAVAQICDILDISVVDLFGTNINNKYSDKERNIISQYHKKTDLQKAVNILLDIETMENDIKN